METSFILYFEWLSQLSSITFATPLTNTTNDETSIDVYKSQKGYLQASVCPAERKKIYVKSLGQERRLHTGDEPF